VKTAMETIYDDAVPQSRKLVAPVILRAALGPKNPYRTDNASVS
jgi:hypothetical protein